MVSIQALTLHSLPLMRILVLLLAACDVGSVLPDGNGPAPLQITATTTPNGGEYVPDNVVAVWIEKADGTIVKTIGRWSRLRTNFLLAWGQKAGAGDADAVSGATRKNHDTPISVKWNLTDRTKQVVPDGTYTIRMELADTNATTAEQNHQATFTFVKGTAPQTQTALTNGGFTNVAITFDPALLVP